MNHYIYVGNRKRQRIFYCVESHKLYLEPQNVATGFISWIPVISIFAGCVGVTLLRRVDVYFVPPHMGKFVIFSIIVGLVVAYFLAKYVRKLEHNGFAQIAPMGELGQKELVGIFRKSQIISMQYFGGKLLMITFIIFMPFFIEGTGSIFGVVFYPFCWMCFGYLFLYFNSRKRRKAIRKFRQHYIH